MNTPIKNHQRSFSRIGTWDRILFASLLGVAVGVSANAQTVIRYDANGTQTASGTDIYTIQSTAGGAVGDVLILSGDTAHSKGLNIRDALLDFTIQSDTPGVKRTIKSGNNTRLYNFNEASGTSARMTLKDLNYQGADSPVTNAIGLFLHNSTPNTTYELIVDNVSFTGFVNGGYKAGVFGFDNGNLNITVTNGLVFDSNRVNKSKQYGAAIDMESSGKLNITGDSVTFNNNYANGYGGAIHGSNTNITANIIKFTNNTADVYHGGAVNLYNGTLTLTGQGDAALIELSGNSAGEWGGAIRGNTVLSNASIQFANNEAGKLGGAIYGDSVTFSGDATTAVFSGNSAGTSGNDLYITGDAGKLSFTGSGTYSFDGGIVLEKETALTAIDKAQVTISGRANDDTNIYQLRNVSISNGGKLTAVMDQIETLTGILNVAANSTLEWNVGSGAKKDFTGTITGAGQVLKTGAGTMTLSGENTYTGATTVSEGELVFAGSTLPVSAITAAGGTLVLGTAGKDIVAKPKTTLTTNGGAIRVDGNVIINDSSSYVICGGSWTGEGSLVVRGGYMRVNTLDFTNGVTFDGGLILNNDNDAVLQADLTVIKDGSKIQAGWSKTMTLTGALKGSASLTVGKDSGWVRFSGDGSEYTGDLLVQGQMRVGGDGKDTSDASQVLGSGKIQLNGGTIQNNNNHITIPNDLNFTAGSCLKSGWNKSMTYTGALTGSGKLEVLSDSGWVIMGTTSDDTFTGDVQCDWGSTSSMGKMRLAAEQPFGANAGTGNFYGQLDMNGFSQSFKGLYSNTSGSTLKGQIFNNTDKLSTLTLNITGKDLTYQGKIDGNIELIVNADGEGKQTLNNNGSTFTGNVVINGGTLVTTKSYTGTASALGATSTEGGRTITVNAGAELSFGVNDTLGGCDSTNSYDDNRATLIINGGKLSGTGNNALYNATFQNGAELYSNDCRDVWRSFWFKGTTNVSFAGDGSAAEKPVNFNGVPEAIVVPDNAVFNVDDITKNTASDLIVNVTMGNKSSGLITTNSLTKTGAGTMELTSANSYDGGTTVSGGTLKLSGAGTLGTGAVAVNENGTLEIAYDDPAQTLNIPSLTMAEGSVLKLTSGTASIDGDFTAEDGAQLVFELGGTTDSSIFLASGSTLDISDDAVLELLLRDGVSGTYTLIEAENGFGDYADAAFWTDLLTAESDYFWNLSIVGNSLLATADSNVVPEPATWALLLLGISGICFIRRKNAK